MNSAHLHIQTGAVSTKRNHNPNANALPLHSSNDIGYKSISYLIIITILRLLLRHYYLINFIMITLLYYQYNINVYNNYSINAIVIIILGRLIAYLRAIKLSGTIR